MDFGEFALNMIVELLGGAIQAGVSYATLPYFERRRIARRVEDATAEVVEPLLPFLSQEGISDDKQRRLIRTCVEELRPLTSKPELLFQGSLNGQKIFDDLYANRDLPRVIIEDGLKDTYALLCPRIATLLCSIPAAVKDWESEAWSENFRRFDEITTQMRNLFSRVDELATLPSRKADETLTTVRRALAQKIGFELDLTGLRADRPLAGKFEEFFVHPEIKQVITDESGKQIVVTAGTPDESFNQFTRPRHQAIVVGPPGAGKSTWSKWFQRELLSARWTGIAVRIELRSFSSENLPSLHDLIREAAGKHFAEELTAERTVRWLEAKQVIFILDGFDEIRPGERDVVIDWIIDLTTAARGCPFVLTSRPLTTNHLDSLGKTWRPWSIEPFDEARIIDYIQRWYKYTPLLEGNREINAKTLAVSWRDDPTIGPLTGNPLLLSTLLMVHHLDGSLPSGRSQLYRRYVEGMLGLWDDRRRVTATTVQLSLEQKRQILRALALHLFLREEDQLDESETLVWLQGQLQKMNIALLGEDVLATLRERSGLIVGPGIYSFAHKSIGEYLVAETILQGDQRDASGRRIDRFRLFEYRDNDRWNTVTFLWAGLAPIADVESFIDQCLESGALALGCGILADQYERVPTEISRRLLLKTLFQQGKLIQFKEDIIWVVSYPSAHGLGDHIEILTFDLRSLNSRRSFYNLIFRAVHTGALIWSDIHDAEGRIRDLLWMAFATTPKDINEWKACLIAPCPERGSAFLWLFWAAEFGFIYLLTNETRPDIEGASKAYNEACPHMRGLTPIALMCAGLNMIFTSYHNKTPLRVERLTRVLKSLPGSDDGEVAPEWLSGTRDWVLGVGRKTYDNLGDLLSVFVEEIEKLAEEGKLERNATYNRAIEFVNELRERREAL